ncbi:MAG: hypothetical protein R3F29_09600 [Planctomycetota bacterium]
MKRLAIVSFGLTLAASLAAQANTVPGLDGRLTDVNDLTYYGRHGAAYPNGEVGMAMLNTMCNPGSVTIPWYAPMQPNHPKFGFLIVRVAGDRIEQINEWSYCKHAFLSVNVTGNCGPCVNPGTGALMGLNCSDTYAPSNNANRGYLGPPQEIDPWLGTWNPVGSYFDIGDPAQAGFPAPADGNFSLDLGIFDAVDNRVTVDEQDLLTANANYYYALHLIHQGEALANRGDNNAHRGFAPNWNGNNWTFNNTNEGMEYGTVLSRWPGASIDEGRNGNDDGRFYVAVKVTTLGGGQYHYEYAVHNMDNSRGGGAFRLPIDAGATATNFTFGDIDTDAGNDWTAARVGNELVFTMPSAPQPNVLEWNTIYNFGFDVDFPAGVGVCHLDEARPGPGAMTVDVPTQVPAGSTYAQVTPYGRGCGGVDCQTSFYESFASSAAFDLSATSFTLTLVNGEYQVGPGQGSYIVPVGPVLSLGDESSQQVNLAFALPYPGGTTNALHVCSNGYVSAAYNAVEYDPQVSGLLNGQPRWAPLWSDLNPGAGGQIRANAGASMAVISFVNVPNYSGGGTVSFQLQFLPNGTVHCLYQGCTANGNGALAGWSAGGGQPDPGSQDLGATGSAGFSLCQSIVPHLSLTTSARPVLGTQFDLLTGNVPVTGFLGLVGLSVVDFDPGIDLTAIGMTNCDLHIGLGADAFVDLFVLSGATSSYTIQMPSSPTLSGLTFFAQNAIIAPGITPIDLALTNGVRLLSGLN